MKFGIVVSVVDFQKTINYYLKIHYYFDGLRRFVIVVLVLDFLKMINYYY
jgi:hypothetical protein